MSSGFNPFSELSTVTSDNNKASLNKDHSRHHYHNHHYQYTRSSDLNFNNNQFIYNSNNLFENNNLFQAISSNNLSEINKEYSSSLSERSSPKSSLSFNEPFSSPESIAKLSNNRICNGDINNIQATISNRHQLFPSNFIQEIKKEIVNKPNSNNNNNSYSTIYNDPISSLSASGLNSSENQDLFIGSRDRDRDKNVTKLFVGNLPTSTTLPELLDVFKQYGAVNEKLSVVKDQNYAFIHFYNRKEAEVALEEVNDSLFKDRYIRVQFSTSQGYSYKPKGII
jgi:RNA recognition motif-containing protein